MYGGDTNFAGITSPVLNQIVNNDNSAVALASSVNPSKFGQSVTFTATVTAVLPGVGTPSGVVEYFDGTVSLGSATLTAGVATFATANLALGTHPITAYYQGDGVFTPSLSLAVSQVVNQSATSTALASSSNPSVFGQNVTITATVSATAPGTGVPTGTVTFKDGAAIVGTGTFSNGVATFSTSALATATHGLTAIYAGDTNFSTSTSSSLSQVVNQASTSTVLASSSNPSVSGQSIVLSATVSATAPGAGIPTGTVTFKEGAVTLGTGALVNGVATFSTAGLSVTTHTLTAVYGADTNFSASTSATLSQVISQSATTTVVASSASPSVLGQQRDLYRDCQRQRPGLWNGDENGHLQGRGDDARNGHSVQRRGDVHDLDTADARPPYDHRSLRRGYK